MRKIVWMLIFAFLFSSINFSELNESYMFEEDISINGMNSNDMAYEDRIIFGDNSLYFPLNIEFLSNLGILPIWSKDFTKVYINKNLVSYAPEKSGIEKNGYFNLENYKNKEINVFIDGEDRKINSIFNLSSGIYYLPIDDFLIKNLGWKYYDYGNFGKYIYTSEPTEEDFVFMKRNLKYYDLISNYMMIINKNLEKDEANYYAHLIKTASTKYSIDEIWIVAMMWQESNFEKNCEYKGATGLMQMLVSTGKNMGLSKEDLLNPEKSIDSGMRYLKNNLDYYDGDLEKATLAYNQGRLRVDRGTYKTWYIEQVKEKYSKVNDYIENNISEE